MVWKRRCIREVARANTMILSSFQKLFLAMEDKLELKGFPAYLSATWSNEWKSNCMDALVSELLSCLDALKRMRGEPSGS